MRAANTEGSRQKARNARDRIEKHLRGFTERLRRERVLDPACGSGNFLYVALRELLDLEQEVLNHASSLGLDVALPGVGPEQLHGIETSPYAHELAQVVVWIGYLQWMDTAGYGSPPDPVLGPMTNILEMDAILAYDEAGNPVEPEWPEADVIVGNPPFLGGKRLRGELHDAYVDDLFALYRDRVAREADLVTYWFEKTRAEIEASRTKRAGLLATQAIRGGANSRVLQRIKQTGGIFFAESDRKWFLEGAAVQVSMGGFDNGAEKQKTLDGAPVEAIYADLTGDIDLTVAKELSENAGIAFMGDTKGGPFDISPETAQKMLSATGNPNGRPNSDVVRSWANGLDVSRRPRGYHIIDFGVDMLEEDAALYEAPFEYVKEHVKPKRDKSRSTRPDWWLHERPRVDMRSALTGLSHYLVTTRHVKHVIFTWLDQATLPDSALIAFAREDSYLLGVLHSRVHEVWARRKGTQLREAESGFRYTPTTCFETFLFPQPSEERQGDIKEAAGHLDELRRNYLNPEGTSEAELKKRTLTNLYNTRPTWLANAHERLDRVVFAAYGWPADLPEEAILKNLLALNLERSGADAAT